MDKYEVFKKQINDLIDIDLNYYKEKQMKRRITSLLTRNNFKGFDDYFLGLKNDEKLMEEFINYLTINVSEFYRNPKQWEVLEKEILPTLINEINRIPRIWSSACSTGEEPYTIAMLLTNYFDIKDIKIFASDIDLQAMNKAKIGLYNSRALKNLPEKYKKKYFTKVGDNYRINEEIKKCVEYRQIDLLKDEFPKDIDIILARNVMIYFTEEAKKLLYEKFYNSLGKNGILFVGSTEQIILPDRYNFKPIKTFFYNKII